MRGVALDPVKIEDSEGLSQVCNSHSVNLQS